MNRRGFLQTMLVMSAAPAIVRAESLMRIVVPRYFLYGDGIHDDTIAIQAFVDGERVFDATGLTTYLHNGLYLLSDVVTLRKPVGDGRVIDGCRFIGAGFQYTPPPVTHVPRETPMKCWG